ncbi:hypothetical protein [Streptacidiphilus carbonis]|jgi:hypothetical protein|uniref:hypothetical protein n=1 Tax=Streptacidiphilus carbonis TaxID=105422 RepID=UPI0005AADCEB|nr:hypothetical protein [Streptacidiphilus carbonis]
MLEMHELDNESAELLPGREALSTFKFTKVSVTNVTKHIANVGASNTSSAGNFLSLGSVAQSGADQGICISQ